MVIIIALLQSMQMIISRNDCRPLNIAHALTRPDSRYRPKMIKSPTYRHFSSLAALALSLIVPAVSAQEGSSTTSSDNRMESITVIGEKTERSLKDTTSSVSVIANEDLRTMQYYRITDAVADIANVVTLTGAVPDIRGVKGNGAAGGFNSISGGAKARVATLIDGVAEPFVADLTGNSGIWDIEQIEVYRGPQSTSNGRNSIGGSVYIKTADPTFEWQGAARLGFRNEKNYTDTSLMVSGPIVDEKLAFRLTAQRLGAETITQKTEFATNPAPYKVNEIETQRLKGKLLWVLNDDNQLLFTHSRNNEQGDAGRSYYEGTNPWIYKRVSLRDIETDSETTSIKLDSRINDDFSVDVLLAYMDYSWGFDSYEPDPASQQQLQFDQTSLTLDAKINYRSSADSVYGFLGLAYFEREQDILSAGAFPYFGDDKGESKSIYGEINIALSDDFSVLLGGRVERESQNRNFTYSPIVAKLQTNKTILLPKLALQYKLNDNSNLAISARRGYNAAGGALNFRAQEYYYYDQETVNSYELSLRSSNDDGSVNVSANVFYNDYEGYQAQSSSRFIVNMDQAVTYGAEVEATVRPTSNTEVKAGLGLLKTDIKDAGVGYASATGNELNSAPDLTANLGFKYWHNDSVNFGFSAKYIAEYFGDIENTEERKAGDYVLARLNANYELEHWRLAAFVNNVFDKKAFTSVEPVGRRNPEGYVGVVQPRHVGVSVSYIF